MVFFFLQILGNTSYLSASAVFPVNCKSGARAALKSLVEPTIWGSTFFFALQWSFPFTYLCSLQVLVNKYMESLAKVKENCVGSKPRMDHVPFVSHPM